MPYEVDVVASRGSAMAASEPKGVPVKPEERARLLIDDKLAQADWAVQDLKAANLGATRGVAVREYPTDTGPADYVLFVDRRPVGVIEAKRDEAGEILTAAEAQTARYAHATLKWKQDSVPLPFLFEATGQLVRFTDGCDPAPRSREVLAVSRPKCNTVVNGPKLMAYESWPASVRRPRVACASHA